MLQSCLYFLIIKKHHVLSQSSTKITEVAIAEEAEMLTLLCDKLIYRLTSIHTEIHEAATVTTIYIIHILLDVGKMREYQ